MTAQNGTEERQRRAAVRRKINRKIGELKKAVRHAKKADPVFNVLDDSLSDHMDDAQTWMDDWEEGEYDDEIDTN
jgi:hypothetical protein